MKYVLPIKVQHFRITTWGNPLPGNKFQEKPGKKND